MSDLVKRLLRDEVITMPGQAFTLANAGPWLRANDALRKEAAARIAELEAERDAAREQARMSSFMGEGYAFMQKRAMDAEARADRLAAMLGEAEEAVERIERALTYPVATEINPRGWALRPRCDIEFAATELRALLGRLESREVSNE